MLYKIKHQIQIWQKVKYFFLKIESCAEMNKDEYYIK